MGGVWGVFASFDEHSFAGGACVVGGLRDRIRGRFLRSNLGCLAVEGLLGRVR